MVKHWKIVTMIVLLCITTIMIIFLFNSRNHSKNTNQLQLIFAIDIIRHGDRTPIDHVPYFSNHWLNTDKGVLTQKGKDESLILGQELANYYMLQKKLLPEQYNATDISIKTSKRQRTRETAEQILKGMYPNITNIKINSPTTNNPLLPDSFSHQSLLNSFYKNTSQSTINEINKTITEVNQMLDTDFTIEDIGKIDDNIKVNEEHNIKRPNKLPQKYYTKLNTLGTIALINAMKSPEMSCISGFPLANNILILLNKAQINQQPKYVLYVTHDIMMWGLLNLITGKQIETLLPYLAKIRIELFQDSSKTLYVKLSNDDKIIKLCNAELCRLDTFQTHINKNLKTCYKLPSYA